MWSQVGLRKLHYEQSWWRWWNSSWAISNPERWCCESATLNVPENLENSAVATGLEKVSFHANPKEPVKLLSPVQLYAVPWTVAYQGPPSMEFSRQKYWSGLPFTFPGDLPDSGIEPRSSTFQADALPSELSGKPKERQCQRMLKLPHNSTHLTR